MTDPVQRYELDEGGTMKGVEDGYWMTHADHLAALHQARAQVWREVNEKYTELIAKYDTVGVEARFGTWLESRAAQEGSDADIADEELGLVMEALCHNDHSHRCLAARLKRAERVVEEARRVHEAHCCNKTDERCLGIEDFRDISQALDAYDKGVDHALETPPQG